MDPNSFHNVWDCCALFFGLSFQNQSARVPSRGAKVATVWRHTPDGREFSRITPQAPRKGGVMSKGVRPTGHARRVAHFKPGVTPAFTDALTRDRSLRVCLTRLAPCTVVDRVRVCSAVSARVRRGKEGSGKLARFTQFAHLGSTADFVRAGHAASTLLRVSPSPSCIARTVLNAPTACIGARLWWTRLAVVTGGH